MYLKQLRIAGFLSLALATVLIPVTSVADNKTSPQKSGFDKLVEAKFGDKVKVNDYSDMGAEYSSSGTDNTSNETVVSEGPKVNDYSDMGASYGEEEGDEAAGATSAGTSAGAAGDSGEEEVTADMLVVGHGEFNGNCAQCHGQDGVGSTFAPSLVIRLKEMDKAEFFEVVTNGKTVLDSTTGSYSVMPAWGQNPQVMAHLNEIWAYLRARSDGKLGTGRPK